jgi:phosphoglycerol transferase
MYAVTAIICGSLICKIILGFLIAGSPGLSFLGHLYSATTQDFFNATTATNSISKTAELTVGTLSLSSENGSYATKWTSGLMALLNFWTINIRGHILGLCLLFGVSLLVMLRLLSSPLIDSKPRPIQKDYAWFTFLLLFFLVLVSSLYSSLVTLSSNGEILRMHMRYYNFAFPLLLMILPCMFTASTEKTISKKLKYFEIVLWMIVSVIVLLGSWKMMAPYQPTAIDMPELRGIMQYKWFFYASTGIGLLSLLIWIISRKTAIKLFFWVLAPLVLIGSSIGINQNIWQASQPNVYDRAGIVIKQLLNKQELSQLVVAGDNPIELSRTLFYLDQPEVIAQVIKGRVPYEMNMLPSGKKWVLLLDDHLMASNIQNQLNFSGFSLGGGSGEIKIDFQNQSWPSRSLLSTQGLFMPPEPWGTWSVAKEVTLYFNQPLPQEFRLTINARAFGPNIDQPFILEVGNTTTPLIFTQSFNQISTIVKNPNKSIALSIRIPYPVSPSELNLGADTRKLGLAIKDLQINW